MSKQLETWRRLTERYCHRREREILTAPYRRRLRRLLIRVGEALDDAGLICHPSRFGRRQVDFVEGGLFMPDSSRPRPYSETTRRIQFSMLNQFLRGYRGRIKFAYQSQGRGEFYRQVERTRPRIALARGQALELLNAGKKLGIVPLGIIAIQLTMGLRRSEVLRLKVDQLRQPMVLFLGKGERGGGSLVPRLVGELLISLSAKFRKVH